MINTIIITNINIYKYPKQILGIFAILCFLGLWHASKYLYVTTNQDDLISSKQDYFKDYKDFLKEFGDWEYVYVVVNLNEQKDILNAREQAKGFAKDLKQRLDKQSNLFLEVTTQIKTTGLANNLLLLAPSKQYDQISQLFKSHSPLFASFLNIKSLAEWYAWLNLTFNK